MKKTVITIAIILAAINALSQGQITGLDNVGSNDINEFNCTNKDDDHYFRQFVIPIETDGQSVNNGIALTITTNFATNNNYSIRLRDENSR